MMLTLNGQSHTVDVDTTLVALLDAVVGSTRGTAVVVDGTVVPRGDWPTHVLTDGQTVDVISAVPGG